MPPPNLDGDQKLICLHWLHRNLKIFHNKERLKEVIPELWAELKQQTAYKGKEKELETSFKALSKQIKTCKSKPTFVTGKDSIERFESIREWLRIKEAQDAKDSQKDPVVVKDEPPDAEEDAPPAQDASPAQETVAAEDDGPVIGLLGLLGPPPNGARARHEEEPSERHSDEDRGTSEDEYMSDEQEQFHVYDGDEDMEYAGNATEAETVPAEEVTEKNSQPSNHHMATVALRAFEVNSEETTEARPLRVDSDVNVITKVDNSLLEDYSTVDAGERMGDRRAHGWYAVKLGEIADDRSDYRAQFEHARESMRMRRETEDPDIIEEAYAIVVKQETVSLPAFQLNDVNGGAPEIKEESDSTQGQMQPIATGPIETTTLRPSAVEHSETTMERTPGFASLIADIPSESAYLANTATPGSSMELNCLSPMSPPVTPPRRSPRGKTTARQENPVDMIYIDNEVEETPAPVPQYQELRPVTVQHYDEWSSRALHQPMTIDAVTELNNVMSLQGMGNMLPPIAERVAVQNYPGDVFSFCDGSPEEIRPCETAPMTLLPPRRGSSIVLRSRDYGRIPEIGQEESESNQEQMQMVATGPIEATTPRPFAEEHSVTRMGRTPGSASLIAHIPSESPSLANTSTTGGSPTNLDCPSPFSPPVSQEITPRRSPRGRATARPENPDPTRLLRSGKSISGGPSTAIRTDSQERVLRSGKAMNSSINGGEKTPSSYQETPKRRGRSTAASTVTGEPVVGLVFRRRATPAKTEIPRAAPDQPASEETKMRSRTPRAAPTAVEPPPNTTPIVAGWRGRMAAMAEPRRRGRTPTGQVPKKKGRSLASTTRDSTTTGEPVAGQVSRRRSATPAKAGPLLPAQPAVEETKTRGRTPRAAPTAEEVPSKRRGRTPSGGVPKKRGRSLFTTPAHDTPDETREVFSHFKSPAVKSMLDYFATNLPQQQLGPVTDCLKTFLDQKKGAAAGKKKNAG